MSVGNYRQHKQISLTLKTMAPLNMETPHYQRPTHYLLHAFQLKYSVVYSATAEIGFGVPVIGPHTCSILGSEFCD